MVVILPQTNIKTASYDGQHNKHPAHQQTVNFYDLIAFAKASQIACYRLLFGLRRDLYTLMFCRNSLSIRRIKYNIPCGAYIYKR